MLTVAPITSADVPALADLMEEMDRFYGSTEFEATAQRQAQIYERAFGNEAASVLLAYEELSDADRTLAGFATYSFLWPAVGLTRSLFLKELYVAKLLRKKGVGRRLMQGIFDIAESAGCSRVEWMTENTNTEAKTFYSKIGAKPNAEKVFYRVGLDPK